MFIDMHMHEMTCSKDSFLKLDQIVSIAREKGLGAVCITDHDSMGLREYAAEYSRKVDFPIFVGIEFFSLQGDIVAFGIEDYPRERVSAQKFIDLVKAQNGVCFAAHPFRNNNRGLEDNLRRVRGLDGLEVLNGSTSFEACRKAAEYARELAEVIPLLTGLWMVPELYPATAEEMMHKIRFIGELLDHMGLPLVDEALLDQLGPYFQKIEDAQTEK